MSKHVLQTLQTIIHLWDSRLEFSFLSCVHFKLHVARWFIANIHYETRILYSLYLIYSCIYQPLTEIFTGIIAQIEGKQRSYYCLLVFGSDNQDLTPQILCSIHAVSFCNIQVLLLTSHVI